MPPRPRPGVPRLGALPDYQCYSCHSCDDCCRGNLSVPVTPEEAEAIRAQGWAEEPGFFGRELFIEHQGGLYLAQDGATGCIFLDPAGGCRIHARFGLEAKPLACRLYPHVLVPVGREARVDLHFDCSSVAANLGRPLAAQGDELRAILPEVIATDRFAPVPLRPGVEWTQMRLDRLTAAFEAILTAPDLELTRRLAGLVNLTHVLNNPGLAGLRPDETDTLLTAATARIVEALAADPLHRRRLPAGLRLMFRQHLGLYGRQDRLVAGPGWAQRVPHVLRLLSGHARVPRLRPDWPDVRFRELEGSWGPLPAEVEAVFERYYRVKVQAQSFCGQSFHGADYLSGALALWLTYPILCWLARLYARAEGRRELTVEDAQKALRVADHRHGRTLQQRQPADLKRAEALCTREVLRALIIAYGS